LASWKGNVTWRGGVAMSIGGEVAPGRGTVGDAAYWGDTNLTRLKMMKIDAVDSAATNGR
jgi:hypothetical protein